MKYSVIIPIYNAEKTLSRCIDSIVDQGREDLELLLINDGSTDKSETICKEYQYRHGNIRYFFQRNTGVSAARNVGLNEAQGDYLIFVDSDDYVASNYLEAIDNVLKQRKSELILFCKQYTSGVAANSPYNKTMKNEKKFISQRICHLFRWQQLNAIHAKVFCRDIIERHQLRFHDDLSVGEDSLFVFRYILHVHTIALENTPVYYLDESNIESLTRRYRPYLCDQFLEIHKRMFEAIDECSWHENDKNQIRSAVIWSYYRCVYSICKDFHKSNWTREQRKVEIRIVCSRFSEQGIKAADWKCQLIALPVQMRMATAIDWITGLR